MRRLLVVALIALAFHGCTPKPQPSPSPSPSPTPLDCRKIMCIPGRHCEQGKGCVPDSPACIIPTEEQQWVAIETPATEEGKTQVRAAQQLLGDVCGNAPNASLEALAQTLRAEGLCAGAMEDSVFLQRADGTFHEWHAVFYGDGCWTQNRAKGVWARR